MRDAAHGTICATPTSVSTSTASSPRSPFGIAWTTVKAGSGAGVDDADATVTSNTRLPVDATSPDGRRPAPVGQHDRLPHPQAAYGDGVVRLVALDGDRRPHIDPVQRRDEVHGQGHQRDISAC